MLEQKANRHMTWYVSSIVLPKNLTTKTQPSLSGGKCPDETHNPHTLSKRTSCSTSHKRHDTTHASLTGTISQQNMPGITSRIDKLSKLRVRETNPS